MSWNRKNLENYYEIYLKASLELVQKRDPKNLYKNSKNKKNKNIVGLDIDWIEPKKYDLLIDMNNERSAEDTINKLIHSLKKYKKVFNA